MKKFIIILIVVILVAIGAYALLWGGEDTKTDDNGQTATTSEQDQSQQNQINDDNQDERESVQPQEVIGQSVEGRDITAYHYGTGDRELLIVGGIHGGYSANTTLLARDVKDHIENNPELVPSDVMVTVIPVLNPDGLYEALGTTGSFSSADIPDDSGVRNDGRFNANDIDLNRNFDCNWSSTGTWQQQNVDGGSEPFSEPESDALRAYVEDSNVIGAIMYYSAAGGVYTSSCNSGVLSATNSLMNTYADASGYSAEGSFDAYELTGDASDWMARENIPAISVILETHTSAEWNQNRDAIEAVMNALNN